MEDEREERFPGILEGLPDLIWEADGDLRLTYLGPQSLAMTGYAPAELLQEGIFDHVPEGERSAAEREARERLLRDGGLRDFQYRMVRKDGQMITLEANASVLHPEGGEIRVVGTCRDVTRRLTTERGLRNANARLSLLSSITRHDTMNQVQVMKGYLELAESMAQDERRRANLLRIREAAEQIQKQLEFTKEYERMGLDEPAWIRLADMGAKLQQEAAKKGVSCTLGRLEHEIYADNMFDKVFFNFLDNSLRHGKQVRNVRLDSSEEGDVLRIIYSDDGVGVAEKDKPKLFQRGYGSHTGMGLFLAKEILSITDLSIDEEGRPGKGVRFVIRVPKGHFRGQG
jgi:PAS domain S-box-containing protein